MIIPLLLLIISIALLVKSSDFFVEYSSRIARKLGISEFVIGVTLVALGTSLPELMSSLYASYINKPDLVVGNIIGSNIANIGLILGIGALMFTININRRTLMRDGMVLLFATLLFSFLLFFGIGMIAGIFLVALFFIYTFRKLGKPEHGNKNNEKVFQDFLIVILSGVGIYFGAKYTVNNAVEIAQILNVPEFVIAFTLIALGTSLPELAVTISSAKKGKPDILVGNVIGSNIANILLVGGASALFSTLMISSIFSIAAMILLTVMLLFFLRNKLRKPHGIAFIILYLAIIYLSFVM